MRAVLVWGVGVAWAWWGGGGGGGSQVIFSRLFTTNGGPTDLCTDSSSAMSMLHAPSWHRLCKPPSPSSQGTVWVPRRR